MSSTKEAKEHLRKTLTLERDGFDKTYKESADCRINARLSALVCYRYASLLLFYYPIRSEVDVRPALRAALKAGRQVALPLCDKSKPGVMTFHYIRSEDDLEPGKFGVYEPKEDTPIVSEELYKQKDTLTVVPAIAFDKQGYRLGYGGGYYDRFLSVFEGTTVGICYAPLFKKELPRGFYDRKVDLVITDRGVKKIDE